MQVVRDLLRALHQPALVGELLFLARLGGKLRQLGDRVFQPVAVGRRRRDLATRLRQRACRRAPRGPGARGVASIDAAEAVEQRAVTGRRQQPSVVVLAVNLDQMPRHLPQQRGGGGLVVDEAAAAAIRLDQAAHDQRLAGLDLQAIFFQQGRQPATIGGRVEGGGDHRLARAVADQRAVAAPAQREAERVEQDRLARAGFARQHPQPFVEPEVQRLDQHHVADGKGGQHRGAI